MNKSLLNLNLEENEEILLKKIKYLLKNNVDINEQNNDGNTFLMEAIRFRKNKIVKYLLDNNADQTLKNNNLDNPLFFSLIFSNRKSFQLLIENSFKIKKHKILLNSVDKDGETLPMYAFMASVYREYEKDIMIGMFEDILSMSEYSLNIEHKGLRNQTLYNLIIQENSKEGLDLYNKYINKEFKQLNNEKIEEIKKRKIKNTKKIKDINTLDLNSELTFI